MHTANIRSGREKEILHRSRGEGPFLTKRTCKCAAAGMSHVKQPWEVGKRNHFKRLKNRGWIQWESSFTEGEKVGALESMRCGGGTDSGLYQQLSFNRTGKRKPL